MALTFGFDDPVITVFINVILCIGSILLGSGVAGGYCVYGLATFLYYAIYPPVSPACFHHVLLAVYPMTKCSYADMRLITNVCRHSCCT